MMSNNAWNSPHRMSKVAWVLWGALLWGEGVAHAQTNLETNAGIQFNFSIPGARSLALGGAFLALADDATAAYTNPAGLMTIPESQVHLEVRNWNYTHIFTDRGRLEGQPTNCVGVDPPPSPCADDTPDLVDGRAEDGVTGVSFFSYVYPRRPWFIALYRQELANFEANFSTQGAFLSQTRTRLPVGFPAVASGRLASLRNEMSLDIVNHGISVAYRFKTGISRSNKESSRATEETYSAIGLGLSYHSFSIRSTTDRFLPGLFDTPDFDDDNNLSDTQTQTGDDSDMSITLGLIWGINKKWNIGGVYRQGPNFGFDAKSEAGPGAVSRPLLQQLLEEPVRQRAEFHVPDAYGLAVAFKPADAIRITFDYDRVEYSDLMQGFIDIFNVETLFEGDVDPEQEQFKIDDADELHLGVEYFFPNLKTPLAVRLGAWFDPDHSLRFEGENPGLQAVFRKRDDELHYSIGIGIDSKRFRFDAAFDYSNRISIGSLSTVVFF